MHGSRRARGRARGHARQVHARGAKGVRLDCRRGDGGGGGSGEKENGQYAAASTARPRVAREGSRSPGGSPKRRRAASTNPVGTSVAFERDEGKAPKAPRAGGRASAPALAVEQRRERWRAARSDARARQPRRWRVREARAVPRNVFRGRVGSRSRRRGPAAAAAPAAAGPPDARARMLVPAPGAAGAAGVRAARAGRSRASLRRGRVAAAPPAPRRGRSRRRPRRAAPSFPSRAGPNRSRWTRARPRPSARRRPGRSGRRALR